MRNINRSRLHACCPQTNQNRAPSNPNKIFACLATRFDVQKSTIQSVIKLDWPIVQYGRVSRLEGGDLMVSCYFVKQTAEDSRDASFVRVSLAFFLYLQFLRLSSPVYPTCRSTCSPSWKNTGLQVAKFLWPTKPYSSFGVTINTTTKVR